MTQAEHNIASRKIEAAQARVNLALLALGSYTGDMQLGRTVRLLAQAQTRCEAAAIYIQEKAGR